MRRDIIIIGAGPAGLAAASAAARHGKRVLILEKSQRVATKLLLAGGGKGNITNKRVSPADYMGETPDFPAYALDRCTPEMVCRALEKANIPLEECDHGRIFCKTSAKDVLRLLLSRLPKHLCRLETGAAVARVETGPDGFAVTCGDAAYKAPRLIAASGGPAWPQCGADDSGLRLMRLLGHRIAPPRPVLCPLVMPPDWPLAGLAGVSLPVRVACGAPGAPAFTDALLFTHKGVSGPAALQISCYWRKGIDVTIDFLPKTSAEKILDAATGKATPRSLFSGLLPDRLLAALIPPDVAARRAAELSRKQRAALADALHNHVVRPSRNEGLSKAEATAGGVDAKEADPFTMESRIVPGLFFCGEILDVTGRLGGYNLHWAWASGLVAGEAAAAPDV